MRGAGDKRQEDEEKKKRAGACYTSIPKTFWERQVLSEGVIYLVFHAESTFTTSLFFFVAPAECLIGLLAVADGGDPQSPIRCFTTNETLNLPSCTCNRKSRPDAMCVKWITQRKTLHIRQKEEGGKKREGEIFITV